MSDMKCPFCQQELHQDQDGYYTCYTDNCGCMAYGGNGASGSESLWKTLITTRKALDVAVDALKRVRKCHNYTTDEGFVAYEALYKLGEIEQINEITKGGDNE